MRGAAEGGKNLTVALKHWGTDPMPVLEAVQLVPHGHRSPNFGECP